MWSTCYSMEFAQPMKTTYEFACSESKHGMDFYHLSGSPICSKIKKNNRNAARRSASVIFVNENENENAKKAKLVTQRKC